MQFTTASTSVIQAKLYIRKPDADSCGAEPLCLNDSPIWCEERGGSQHSEKAGGVLQGQKLGEPL